MMDEFNHTYTTYYSHPRYEYMVASGDYGALEKTLNYYGNLGWVPARIDLDFNMKMVPNDNKELIYEKSDTPQWCVVFERVIVV